MIVLLSPAKSLDFSPSRLDTATQPAALDQSEALVARMRRFDANGLRDLMGISEKLAALNVERFRSFATPFTPSNAKQALLAFKGDTYRDLPLDAYDDADFEYAQRHVRILSGLYGLLRPLDLIQPYRLEMGTRLTTERGRDLYAFWGDRITEAVNRALAEQGDVRDDVVVNCASDVYFKAVDPGRLEGRVVKPIFKDYKKGTYKVISFYAKRARGLMADFVVRGRVATVQGLKDFEGAGYRFDPKGSTESELVFLRRQ